MYYNIYEGSAPDTQYIKIALHLAMTVTGLFAFATSLRPAADGNFGNPRLSIGFNGFRQPRSVYSSGMRLYHNRTYLVHNRISILLFI